MMLLPLMHITLLTVVIFLPLGLIVERENIQQKYVFAIFGASVWAIVFAFHFSIFQFTHFIWTDFDLAINYSQTSTIQVVSTMNGVLFFVLLINSLASEIMRYVGIKRFIGYGGPLVTYAIFGLGWGVLEFLSRFLFFTSSFDLELQGTLFGFILVQNVILSLLIIRTQESDKFIMFSFFIKFFTEMGIMGSLGFEHSYSDFLLEVSAMLLIVVITVYLSLIVRDPSHYQSIQEDIQSN